MEPVLGALVSQTVPLPFLPGAPPPARPPVPLLADLVGRAEPGRRTVVALLAPLLLLVEPRRPPAARAAAAARRRAAALPRATLPTAPPPPRELLPLPSPPPLLASSMLSAAKASSYSTVNPPSPRGPFALPFCCSMLPLLPGVDADGQTMFNVSWITSCFMTLPHGHAT